MAPRILLTLITALGFTATSLHAAEYDVVVYGGTSASVSAAVPRKAVVL
jgi:hypothetical protein